MFLIFIKYHIKLILNQLLFFPAVEMQRKWKSFRDSFRRELAKTKQTKSGSGADTGRKQYIYFKQLMFLLPICETKPQQEGEEAQGSNTEVESITPQSTRLGQKRKKISVATEEHLLIQKIAKNMENKAKETEKDDPDRHFLLSLLPHFKSLREDTKLEVQGQFISILQQYKRRESFSYAASSSSQNIQRNLPHTITSHSQDMPYTMGVHNPYMQHPTTSNPEILTELQPVPLISPQSEADSRPGSTDVESICNDFF